MIVFMGLFIAACIISATLQGYKQYLEFKALKKFINKDQKVSVDNILEAQWVIDSETSGEVLINCKTSEIIGRKDKYGKWVHLDGK